MTWRVWKWGFWLRLGRFGPGIALHNHNQHPPLFSERNGLGRNRYLHVGPWCVRTLASSPKAGEDT